MAKRTYWCMSFDQRSIGLRRPDSTRSINIMKSILRESFSHKFEVGNIRSDLISFYITGTKSIEEIHHIIDSVYPKIKPMIIDSMSKCLIEKYDTKGNKLEEFWYQPKDLAQTGYAEISG